MGTVPTMQASRGRGVIWALSALSLCWGWRYVDFLTYTQSGMFNVLGRACSWAITLVPLVWVAVLGGMQRHPTRHRKAATLGSFLLLLLWTGLALAGEGKFLELRAPREPDRGGQAARANETWVVVGIDGSASDETFNLDGSPHANSHVFNFMNGLTGVPFRAYFHGPATLGPNHSGHDVDRIRDLALRYITNAMAAIRRGGREPRVALVGHSRGGLAALLVAKCLSDRGDHVAFMGLLDAVDRRPPWYRAAAGVIGLEAPTKVPPGVEHAFHIIRDRAAWSQIWFGNTGLGTEGRDNLTIAVAPPASHTAVGGDPWNQQGFGKIDQYIMWLRHPLTDLAAGDRRASTAVWNALQRQAARAGLIVMDPRRIGRSGIDPTRDIFWGPNRDTLSNHQPDLSSIPLQPSLTAH